MTSREGGSDGGQESNPTNLRLARMNLAIRGIDAKLELGDTFLNNRHPDQKMDFENAGYYRCRRASNLSVRFASGSA